MDQKDHLTVRKDRPHRIPAALCTSRDPLHRPGRCATADALCALTGISFGGRQLRRRRIEA